MPGALWRGRPTGSTSRYIHQYTRPCLLPRAIRRYGERMAPKHPTPEERDERFTLPLDPEEALRGLLAVKPDEPDDDEDQANSEG